MPDAGCAPVVTVCRVCLERHKTGPNGLSQRNVILTHVLPAQTSDLRGPEPSVQAYIGACLGSSSVGIEVAMYLPNLFEEIYRVVAVEEENLTVQGLRSGEVLTISSHDLVNPFTAEDYPRGTLIQVSEPTLSWVN